MSKKPMIRIGSRSTSGDVWTGSQWVSKKTYLEMALTISLPTPDEFGTERTDREEGAREEGAVREQEGLPADIKMRIAADVYAVFADPKATSAEVLDALIGYLTMNNISFSTATGDIGVHLTAAIQALREMPSAPNRRFLGMPKNGEQG